MRQTVSGRLRSWPLAISTILARSSTRRCRLRLPSVRAHSSFRSLKVTPRGLVMSEVSTLSRARSWITRSKPSYAKRPSFDRLLVLIARLPLVEEQNSGYEQLPGAVGNAHRPRRKRARVGQRQAEEPGE